MLKNKSNPQVVPSLEGLFIADVAVGCEHVLALTSTGDVYAWGCNSEGQVSGSDGGAPRRPSRRTALSLDLRAACSNIPFCLRVTCSWASDTPTW